MRREAWCHIRGLLFFAGLLLALPETAIAESGQLRDPHPDDAFRRHAVNEVFQGTPAPVDLQSDPQAGHFSTRLQEGAKHGPNFAGAYTVIEWGCGTSCQQVAVVDARTGQMSDWLTTEYGSSYQVNSRLFVKNPQTDECSSLEWCKTEYYLFEKGKFILFDQASLTSESARQPPGP